MTDQLYAIYRNFDQIFSATETQDNKNENNSDIVNVGHEEKLTDEISSTNNNSGNHILETK